MTHVLYTARRAVDAKAHVLKHMLGYGRGHGQKEQQIKMNDDK